MKWLFHSHIFVSAPYLLERFHGVVSLTMAYAVFDHMNELERFGCLTMIGMTFWSIREVFGVVAHLVKRWSRYAKLAFAAIWASVVAAFLLAGRVGRLSKEFLRKFVARFVGT